MRIGTVRTLTLMILLAAALPAQDCPFNYSNMNLPGLAGGVSFYRNSGLVTNLVFTDQLKVVDIADASKPKVVWSQSFAALCPTTAVLWPASIVGQRAYVPFVCNEVGGGPDPTGLLIFDIANPYAPVEKPRYEVIAPDADGFTGLVVVGSKGYASSGAAGLRVLDLTDPLVPVPVTSLETEGYAAGIAAMTSHVLILDRPFGGERGDGLVVVDVSKPGQPRKASSFTGAQNPVQFLYAAGYAYIADQGELGSGEGAGVWIVDLTAPGTPGASAFYSTELPPWGLALKGDNLYVGTTTAEGGMLVLNVADKAKPFLKGSTVTLMSSGAVQANGNYVYLGVQGLLKVYDPAGCEASHHSRPLGRP
jgi:hypothetical protein